MTYFGFLLIFLVVPIALLFTFWLVQRQFEKSAARRYAWRAVWPAILAMVVLAVTYTTPWDNYLVATRVWWYDPALVSGLVIGWVPIEEYTFFVLQTVLGGLWLANLAVSAPPSGDQSDARPRLQRGALWLVALWLIAALALILDVPPATYLGLELVWALPPLALQVAFGGDLLWRRRWLVLAGFLPLTVYLSAADSLAITMGTWTINPDQSLGILLGGVLPIEEAVFFLLTNLLVTFGTVLIWTPESRTRALSWSRHVRGWLSRSGAGAPFKTDASRRAD